MKNILLLSLLLATAAAHAQAVLRVNNTVGSAAPYTTIAAAVTAAGVNDIIMVEGSNSGYGDITINKKVTIIGPGYFVDENTNLQATPLSAYVNTITLNSGASGSSISGMVYTDFTAMVINSVSNLSILNSYFAGGANTNVVRIFGTGNNLLILGNYTYNSNIVLLSSTYSGVLVANNYLRRIETGASSVLVSNNVLNTTTGAEIDVRNSTVQNNIFLTPITNAFSNSTGSIIKNNVFVGAQVGVDATNLINQPLASLFVGLPGNTTDTQWRLKTGSPAIGAGVGNADCGIYGGTTPYRPSGIVVGQPTITDYVFPATVPKNGVLNVKVSGKVN